MPKTTGLILSAALLLSSASSVRDRFSNYKSVEAYEIRQGILMMPRYSSDGEVCEIGIQRRQYSPEVLWPSAALTEEEIGQIFDELVSDKQRGLRSVDPLDSLEVATGSVLTERREYENVSLLVAYELSISGPKFDDAKVHDNVAVIRWKNRKCQ